MPYYHYNCGGRVKWYPFLPIPPKCEGCGKRWSPLVVYGPRRRDMYFVVERKPVELPMGKTPYAKWADSAPPGVALMASHLPRWPRWLRLASFLGSIIVLSALFYGLYQVGVWTVLVGAFVLAVSPVIIYLVKSKKGRG